MHVIVNRQKKENVCFLTSGCFVNPLCPFPLLSSCNTTCNPVAFSISYCTDSPTVIPTSSSSPTLPTPQEPISAVAIAGLAVAGIVVAVIAVTLSDS